MYSPRVFRNSNMFNPGNNANGMLPRRRGNRNRNYAPRVRTSRPRFKRNGKNRQFANDVLNLQQQLNAFRPISMNNGMRPSNINNRYNGRPYKRNTRDVPVRNMVPVGTTIDQSEALSTIRKGLNVINFHPGNISDGAFLCNIFASIFDNCILERGVVLFRSSVATTRSGTVYIGIDYSGNAPTTVEGVRALDHMQQFTIYGNGNVIINANSAMKSKQHYCYRPGMESEIAGPFCKICVFVETDEDINVVGTLNISYRIKYLNIDPHSLIKLSAFAVNQATVLANQLPIESQPSPEPAREATDNPSDRHPEVTVVNAKDNIKNENVDGTVSTFDIGKPKVNDIISTVTTPVANADGYLAAVPKVNFHYSDGSKLEEGTIVPLDAPKVNGIKVAAMHNINLTSDYQVDDILGTIWKVLKPIAKEGLSIVTDIAHEIIDGQSVAKLADDEDVPYDLLIDAVAYGDEVTIDIPKAPALTMRDYNISTQQLMASSTTADVPLNHLYLPAAAYLMENSLSKQSFQVKSGETYQDLVQAVQLDIPIVKIYCTYELKQANSGDLLTWSCLYTKGDITTGGADVQVANFLAVKDDRSTAVDNWEPVTAGTPTSFPSYITLKPGFDEYKISFMIDVSGITSSQIQQRFSPTLTRMNTAMRKDVTIPDPNAPTRSRARFLV